MRQKQGMLCFAGLLMGVLAFFILYGPATLDVQYDAWILNGYAEADVTQHYAGWVNYRQSPWAWPLGLIENVRQPDTAVLTFTDSIPLASILLKLFSPILPETFQFFGWYILLCFALQGVAAALLIGLFVRRMLPACLALIPFVFSPVLMERAFRHCALASHFLILFALYFLLRSRQEGYRRMPWEYIPLCGASVGIHPYFVPMVGGVMLINALCCMTRGRRFWRPAALSLAGMTAVGVVGYAIGAFGTGISGVNTGFGYYSMNLNAPLNPTSLGVDRWSSLLAVRPQGLYQYDGFNYLGLGLLIAAPVSALLWLIFAGRRHVRKWMKSNWELLLMCVLFTLFAISNVVAWDAKTLLTVPLPGKVMKLCNIFQASSRMFYPVYYLLALFCVTALARVPGRAVGSVLLAVLCAVQLWDISPAIAQKRERFSTVETDGSAFADAKWEKLAEGKTELLLLDSVYRQEQAACFAARNAMTTNAAIMNRGNFAAVASLRRQLTEGLLAGTERDEKALYLTDDPDLKEELKAGVDDSHYRICEVGKFLVIWVP